MRADTSHFYEANTRLADTHLSPRYFAEVAKCHLEFPETNAETIYVPPLVFDRNLHHVPLPVRTGDLMWAGAGLSSLYAGSSVCIPTSVYSLPMTLVERVGGWDTGPSAIGEDMHMYIKCFFALSGNVKARVVYAAASQCNVSSDLDGLKGYVDGLRARYGQALRHMWGSMDTGYAVRQSLGMVRTHYRARQSGGERLLSTSELAWFVKDALLAGISTVCSFNWIAFHTDTEKQKPPTSKPAKTTPVSLKPIHLRNICTLFYRMFEAHFLPIHLAIILPASDIYNATSGSSMPEELASVFRICGYLRWLGWGLMCVYFYRYEKYHHLCVNLRKEEMRQAGLLDEITEHDGFCTRVYSTFWLLEGGLFPLGGFIFGAVPALQAVLSHLFTDRLVYHVSLKPQFNIQPWRGSSSQPRPSHTHYPSESWRKQALSQLDYAASAMRYRPVKREE